ncbi:MAG: 3-deoxy-7-phosphoheptulonate synthase [Deltaproteobacteria bacterium]|nr:3-deoxy-7-phosphoheptulonate synthase [Deltaproteobacteria bacterium]
MTSTLPTQNLRVRSEVGLTPPRDLQKELPLSDAAQATVIEARDSIRGLLLGTNPNPRLMVVVGPCSIHDVKAAREYANLVEKWREQYGRQLLILMRVYFEKPRTTTGWKGLLNDPHLDGSYDIEAGLRTGRSLLVELAERGIPAASEILDPIAPQYLGDVIAWAAIGARTTESQTHREMASGVSMPVGFKNGTDGTFDSAINAMRSASEPHHFLGIDGGGRVSMIGTAGNADTHIVLRGGAGGPNFDAASVVAATAILDKQKLCSRILIDCSHGNSRKDYRRQPEVSADVAKQLYAGSRNILGVMIESHLQPGNQPFSVETKKPLQYGLSITDGCVAPDTTDAMLAELAGAVAART